jgi:hypothetical protein
MRVQVTVAGYYLAPTGSRAWMTDTAALHVPCMQAMPAPLYRRPPLQHLGSHALCCRDHAHNRLPACRSAGRMHIINEKPYAIPFYFVLFQVSSSCCAPRAALPKHAGRILLYPCVMHTLLLPAASARMPPGACVLLLVRSTHLLAIHPDARCGCMASRCVKRTSKSTRAPSVIR